MFVVRFVRNRPFPRHEKFPIGLGERFPGRPALRRQIVERGRLAELLDLCEFLFDLLARRLEGGGGMLEPFVSNSKPLRDEIALLKQVVESIEQRVFAQAMRRAIEHNGEMIPVLVIVRQQIGKMLFMINDDIEQPVLCVVHRVVCLTFAPEAPGVGRGLHG